MKLWYNAFPTAYGEPSKEKVKKADNACLVESNRIFNWDALPVSQTSAESTWLEKLTADSWVMIPQELADPTNWENFYEYVKIPRNPETKYEYFYLALRDGEEH